MCVDFGLNVVLNSCSVFWFRVFCCTISLFLPVNASVRDCAVHFALLSKICWYGCLVFYGSSGRNNRCEPSALGFVDIFCWVRDREKDKGRVLAGPAWDAPHVLLLEDVVKAIWIRVRPANRQGSGFNSNSQRRSGRLCWPGRWIRTRNLARDSRYLLRLRYKRPISSLDAEKWPLALKQVFKHTIFFLQKMRIL